MNTFKERRKSFVRPIKSSALFGEGINAIE
jgi:hypothetical protein